MAELTSIQIAELIEQGLAWVSRPSVSNIVVKESSEFFLTVRGCTYLACALGLAMIAKYRDPQAAYDRWNKALDDPCSSGAVEAAAKVLEIPMALAETINSSHSHGACAQQIIEHLRTRGLTTAT